MRIGRYLMTCVFVMALIGMVGQVCEADPAPPSAAEKASGEPPGKSEAALSPPAKVDVEPAAHDSQIAKRLLKILEATGWFEDPSVRVRDGVVFLEGTAQTSEYKNWASDLVRNTQDVVAVVNKMQVSHPAILDLRPAFDGLRDIWRASVQALPFFAVGIAIFVVAVFAARLAQRGTERLLQRRVTIPLIRELIARAMAIVVFIVGLYTVLKVSGTTQLALTVLGGTGLFGLVLGIAFRDITENFLASIFLSMQRPFQVGDLVEIVGVTGYIDRLTVRTTIVISLDGNYVQIPNATVYKNTIRNFTNQSRT